MRIAIVEDDTVIAELMNRTLLKGFSERGQHINITNFDTCKSFIHVASRETFDIVFLDWHLPDGTGIELIDWMKQYLEALPAVLMVTQRCEENDAIEALNAGADDFISKPFRPGELVARANAAVRRRALQTSSIAQQRELEFEGIKLNTNREVAYVNGQEVSLTRQEFRLAFLLLNQLGSPLSRSYLYEYVWGRSNAPNTRTLDVHIHRVRKKLQLTVDNGWSLASVYGYGYRLQKVERHVEKAPQDAVKQPNP